MVRRFWRMVVMNEAKIMMLLCLLIGVVLMTGCIKRYRSTETETEIEFATGIDFGFSASGTDTLDNNIGIQPSKTYARGK